MRFKSDRQRKAVMMNYYGYPRSRRELASKAGKAFQKKLSFGALSEKSEHPQLTSVGSIRIAKQHLALNPDYYKKDIAAYKRKYERCVRKVKKSGRVNEAKTTNTGLGLAGGYNPWAVCRSSVKR